MSTWNSILLSVPSSLQEVFADHKDNPDSVYVSHEEFIGFLISSSASHSGQGIGIAPNGCQDAIRSAKTNYNQDGGNLSKTNRLFISIRSGTVLSSNRVREIMTLIKNDLSHEAHIQYASAINSKLNDNVVVTLVGTDEIQTGEVSAF